MVLEMLENLPIEGHNFQFKFGGYQHKVQSSCKGFTTNQGVF